MRVRISYGIDLEKAPHKVNALLSEAISDIRSKVDNMERLKFLLESDEHISLAPGIIDEARKGLSDIDQVLADASAIAEGYVAVKDQMRIREEPEPTSVPEEPSDVREG